MIESQQVWHRSGRQDEGELKGRPESVSHLSSTPTEHVSVEGQGHIVGQFGYPVELTHLAGDDAHPVAFAVDQVAQVTQGGEILIKSVQRISTTADGDKGLRALPDEGQDRLI